MVGIQRIPGPAGFSYSDAVGVAATGEWVFVSGQVGWDEDKKVVDGLGPQAQACFSLIEKALDGLGGSLRNVVKVTAYVTTFDDYASYGQARAEAFGDHLPASATVQVAGLLAEGAMIEIDAIAFIEHPA